MTRIELEGVSKSFDGREGKLEVLDEISLSVQPGEARACRQPG